MGFCTLLHISFLYGCVDCMFIASMVHCVFENLRKNNFLQWPGQVIKLSNGCQCQKGRLQFWDWQPCRGLSVIKLGIFLVLAHSMRFLVWAYLRTRHTLVYCLLLTSIFVRSALPSSLTETSGTDFRKHPFLHQREDNDETIIV